MINCKCISLISLAPKAEQLTLELIDTTVFRNLATGLRYPSILTREENKDQLQSYMTVYLASDLLKTS